MKHPDLLGLSSLLAKETDSQPKLDSPIVIGVGHMGTGNMHTIHQLIEILDHIPGSEGRLIVVGASIHEDKEILQHHQLMQEGAQEANMSVVGIIAGKVSQIQEELGHREELMQPIDIQLISRRKDEDLGEKQCIVTETQLDYQQKKSAKYFVPKTQSAKKASNKPYRQRKK